MKPVTTASETQPAAAAEEVRRLRNYVAGSWQAASVAETLEDRDPVSGEISALVPLSGEAEVDAAVGAARAAQAEWRNVPPQRRARAIMSLRTALLERREDLARLVTEDMGKTIDDARGEVTRGIESVEAACAIPHLLKGENLEGVAGGVDVELFRQPVGVVAAITPFNFPAMIPLWFAPLAVAAGNTMVMKPSQRTPLTANRLAELFAEAGFPDGVLNVVHGAQEAVEALIDHQAVRAISFVGSAPVARKVYERSGLRGKRVQALAGAKNHMIVMPDADIDQAVRGVFASAFSNAGQRCLAGSVAVGVGGIGEELREGLAQMARDAHIAPGDEPGTDADTAVTPVTTAEARDRISGYIQLGEKEGARLIVDGRGEDGEGYFLGPTLFDE
ncbi:MAG: aldehyde dehydrogenase family protein, partial [Solirubrobacterales bacterium]